MQTRICSDKNGEEWSELSSWVFSSNQDWWKTKMQERTWRLEKFLGCKAWHPTQYPFIQIGTVYKSYRQSVCIVPSWSPCLVADTEAKYHQIFQTNPCEHWHIMSSMRHHIPVKQQTKMQMCSNMLRILTAGQNSWMFDTNSKGNIIFSSMLWGLWIFCSLATVLASPTALKHDCHLSQLHKQWK